MREVGIVGRYRFNPTTDEDAISGRLLDVVADPGRLAFAKEATLSGDDLELLAAFVAYFRALRFWQDEDSGHWEEVKGWA